MSEKRKEITFAIVLAIVLLGFVAVLVSCDAVVGAAGGVTKQERDETQALYDKSTAAIIASEAAIGASAAEIKALADDRTKLVGEYEALMKTRAALNASYLTAPPEQSDGILLASKANDAAIKDVEARLDALRTQATTAQGALAKAQQEAKQAQADADAALEVAATWKERNAQAKANLEAAGEDLGKSAGSMWPGAALIGGPIGKLIGGLLAGGAVGGVGVGMPMLARLRKRKEEVEAAEENVQRVTVTKDGEISDLFRRLEGALNVIGVTEKFEIEKIANDPTTRSLARLAVALLPDAQAAFDEGKERAEALRLPAVVEKKLAA